MILVLFLEMAKGIGMNCHDSPHLNRGRKGILGKFVKNSMMFLSFPSILSPYCPNLHRLEHQRVFIKKLLVRELFCRSQFQHFRTSSTFFTSSIPEATFTSYFFKDSGPTSSTQILAATKTITKGDIFIFPCGLIHL